MAPSHPDRGVPHRARAWIAGVLACACVAATALSQTPSAADLFGAALVIGGVVIQDRDELPVTGEDVAG